MRNLRALARPALAAAAALPGVAGYLAAGGGDPGVSAALFLGLLALGGGASALNQVQERDVDARMPRTMNRPLPAGALTCPFALGFAFALSAAGLALIAAAGGAMPVALGLSAFALYNGFYTPLKRRTPWAAFAGALVGGLIPAVGWAAAGAPLAAAPLTALCFFFWIWQGPHFWLLAARYGREAAAAGLASPAMRLAPAQIERVAAAWLAASAASALLPPLFGAVRSGVATAALALLAVYLFAASARLAARAGGPDGEGAALLARLNAAVFAATLVFGLDPFLR